MTVLLYGSSQTHHGRLPPAVVYFNQIETDQQGHRVA